VNANGDGLQDAQCHVSADSLVTVRALTQYAWFISEDLSNPFRGDASSFSEINVARPSHKPDMRLGFRLTYSRSDTGSESFFGDCLFRRDTNSRPHAGTPALPSRTISFAVRLRP
jgi:hypothetical protein